MINFRFNNFCFFPIGRFNLDLLILVINVQFRIASVYLGPNLRIISINAHLQTGLDITHLLPLLSHSAPSSEYKNLRRFFVLDQLTFIEFIVVMVHVGLIESGIVDLGDVLDYMVVLVIRDFGINGCFSFYDLFLDLLYVCYRV